MLTGTRIIDLSRVLAGPVCTMMLGDLGADIIKVERPGTGDDTRGWGPPFDARGESAYFLAINRNKLSLAADLDDSDDREVVAGLIRDADVVVENFKRGSLERRGLRRSRLMSERPALIWCTITGFDDRPGSPNADRSGYDFVMQAECGWMAITGSPDGPPTKVGIALADIVAGKDAAIAILGALVARARDGRGRTLELSLARSATAALINVAQGALLTGRDALRWGNAHPNLVPYQLFDAADRPLVIAVGNDAQWKSCAEVLGLPALAADPRFATNAGRVTHRAPLVAELTARIRQRPAEQWLVELERVGVPCGVVKSVLEALAEVDASALTGIAPSVPGTVRHPPPRLDEHGAAIRRRGWRAFEA